MIASPDPFDAQARADLQSLLVANGVARPRAVEVVDLACHAAESATRHLLETCSRGEDFGIKAMAIELALQLAQARMKAIFERTRELGAAHNASTYKGQVGVRL